MKNGDGYDVYEGTFIKSKLNGYGKATYKTGNVYNYLWDNDKAIKFLGTGKITYSNGNVYEGEISNDKRNGQGTMTYKNGNVYKGQWTDNDMNGKGTYTWTDGQIYEGDWHYNNSCDSYESRENNIHLSTPCKHGIAKRKYANGDIYEGKWAYGKRHGEGKYTYENGDIYDGDWTSDMRYGKGKMTYKNGDVYDGQWKNDMRHGKGKMTYANGDIYEGEWQYNMKDGKTTITTNDNITTVKYYITDEIVTQNEYESGTRNGRQVYVSNETDFPGIYNGGFVNHNRHGQGKMTYDNGNVYEGEWKDGKRNGKGKMTYKDGEIYDGDWLYDNQRGIGICKMTYFNGDVYEGEWDDRWAVDRGDNGDNGKMTYADGNVYEGEFKKGKRYGQGKMTYANGNVYEGKWDHDKKNENGLEYIYKNGVICKFRRQEWDGDKLQYSNDWVIDNDEMKKFKARILKEQTHEFDIFKNDLLTNYQMDEKDANEIYDAWNGMYRTIWNEHFTKCNIDMCCVDIGFDVVANKAKDLSNTLVEPMITNKLKKKQ